MNNNGEHSFLVREKGKDMEEPFEKDLEREVEDVLTEIDTYYGPRASIGERLAYHERSHTEEQVLPHAKTLWDVIEAEHKKKYGFGFDPRERCIMIRAVVRHDKIQKSTITRDDTDPLHIPRRIRGESEKASILDLEESMIHAHEERYDSNDIKKGVDAIQATTPLFKEGTAFNNIEKNPSLIVICTAMADLGGAGMDASDVFLKTGDRFFVEDYPEFGDYLYGVPSPNMTDERKELYRQEIIKWAEGQVVFAEGRKRAFEDEILLVPEYAREAVRKLYSHFDENIEALRAEAEIRKVLSFDELAERIRIHLPK
jgi:hypothetical protein